MLVPGGDSGPQECKNRVWDMSEGIWEHPGSAHAPMFECVSLRIQRCVDLCHSINTYAGVCLSCCEWPSKGTSGCGCEDMSTIATVNR